MDDEQAKEDARIAMLIRFRYLLPPEHRRALDAADRELAIIVRCCQLIRLARGCGKCGLDGGPQIPEPPLE
jgi:hypothetical protein